MKNLPILATLTVAFGWLSGAAPVDAQDDTGLVPSLHARLPQLPLIGDRAPEFEAETTRGPIKFPGDYRGKWVVFFSHPGDFTPVCTSEFVAFGAMAHEFAKLNAELLGLSVEDVPTHRAWKAAIRDRIEFQGIRGMEIPFPVIGDPDQEIAWRYGMLHPNASGTRTVRAVFLIDPRGIVRSLLYYPHSNGRNVSEIKRLLIAIQTSDAHRVATPANWEPGEDVLVPLDATREATKRKIDRLGSAVSCQDWYFCTRSLDRSELVLP